MKCPKGREFNSNSPYEFNKNSGQIKRKSYSRKSSRSGKISRVVASCIEDVGAPGKGPKTLPKLSDDIHLSKFGYSLKNKASSRRASLKRASRKIGTLPILKRTNLIANYTAVPENKAKLRADVEYLKRQYSKEKKSKQRKSKKSRK